MFFPVPLQGFIIRYQNPHVYCSGSRVMTETRKCLSHFLSAFPRSPWQRVFPDSLLVLVLLVDPWQFQTGITCPINQTQHHTTQKSHATRILRSPSRKSVATQSWRATSFSPSIAHRSMRPSSASHVTISQIRSNSISFS